MKILYVLNSLGRGGIECLVRDICQNIDRNKFHIEIAVMQGKSMDQYETFKDMGIKIIEYPRLTAKTLLKFVFWWRNFFKANTGYYDIVHIHTFSTAQLYLKYAKKSGAYTIVHSHNSIPKGGTIKQKYVLGRRILLALLKRNKNIDLRMACSDFAGKQIFGSESYVVLLNGIDTNKFSFNPVIRDKVRKQFGWDDSIIIGHVGNGTGAKNHEFLLRVFNEVRKMRPQAKLVLVGNLFRIQTQLNQYVENFDLENNVEFLGVRTDIPDLMSAMDVFVFPSIY